MLHFLQGPRQVAELAGLLRWIGLRPMELTLLLGLTLGQTLTDGLGVALVYPLLAFVANGPDAFVASAPFPLPQIANGIRYIGLPLGLPVLLAILFLTFLVREGFSYLRASSVSKVANRRVSDLQGAALQAYTAADLPFHTTRNRGAFLASIANDCMQSGTLITLVTEALAQICMGVFYGAVLLTLSVPLTLMIGAGALLAVPLFRGQAQRVRAIGAEIIDANKLFNIRLNEVFQAIRLVKVRAQEPAAAERIAEACRGMARGTWRRDRASAAIDALIRPLFVVTALAVFYVALTQLNTTLAALVTFIFGTTRLIPVIARLGVLRGQIPSYMHGPIRTRAMMQEAARQRVIVGGKTAFAGIGEGIRFEQVSFQYLDRSGHPALSDVSFTLRAGEMAAIVGPSGAGKSTLVDLLCRFYEPSSGRILVDGRDIRDYDLKSYRTCISLVQQESLMFDDTIRGNLDFGLPAPLTDKEMREVLRRAHCLEFVEALPNGADTQIGERAVRLSGGQRQRLALARALANRPTLLLLDEPTSALDSVSEQAIQETLREVHGDVTVVVVAHRLSTIIDADRILVLQDGRLAAEGTHDALMGRGGVYRDLFKNQISVVG
jgi:ATP-binding cassette, subfamily B, bacterial MsbA